MELERADFDVILWVYNSKKGESLLFKKSFTIT